MMNQRSGRAVIAVWCVLVAGGCEQVVSIDLHTAGPQIVVEGKVSDQPGPCTVSLTRTGTYFTPELTFPPVAGATVIIQDNMGARDTLREGTSGVYTSKTIRGTPGVTYALTVEAEGGVYTGSSTMPQRVKIDSVYVAVSANSPAGRGYDLYIAFADPPEFGNYYRINVRPTNPAVPSDSVDGRRYRVYSDKLSNGTETVYRLRLRRQISAGDTLTVELMSIDKPTYEYYRTLDNILTSDRSPTSLSPANPNTNLSGGSLGYFAAYTIDSRKIVMPKK
jgi:hypothetical protein